MKLTHTHGAFGDTIVRISFGEWLMMLLGKPIAPSSESFVVRLYASHPAAGARGIPRKAH